MSKAPAVLIPLPSAGSKNERLVWNSGACQHSIVLSVEEFDATLDAMIAVKYAREALKEPA
jgi:hypothetical protein